MVKRKSRHFPRWLKSTLNATIGYLALGTFHLARSFDRIRMSNLFGAITRRVGPLSPRHQIGRANLAAAFPEKSADEVERILNEVWDNVGRIAAEFAHLDRIRFGDARSKYCDVIFDDRSLEMFKLIQKEQNPGIFFAAHLSNWEIPALLWPVAGLEGYALYRSPNIRAIDDAVLKMRASCMGTLVPSGYDAPLRLANALSGGAQVGMLADQRFGRGVEVTFFGRPCKANPLLAELARRFEHPVRGLRVSRLEDRTKFRCEVTPPLALPRDRDGKVDIQGTTQLIASTIEAWVREDPGQWLWLHDRWR